MNARTLLGGIGLVAALALTACGGGGATGGTTGGTAGGSTAAGGGAATTLNVEGTTDLKFQPATLEATANQPITVNFKNPSALQHTWVLVAPGKEEAVDQAAQGKNGDANGIDGVIATGKVLDANQNETISVPAQPAGTYTYICTVPGHYAAGMKGTLTVK